MEVKESMKTMNLNQAVKICKEYNLWRRGQHPYDGDTPEDYKPMPFSPEEFGLAIDKLVKFTESTIQCSTILNKLNDLVKPKRNSKKHHKKEVKSISNLQSKNI